jgi:hypothetical protein
VIHDDDRPTQVEIGDFVLLHAGEVIAAVGAGWPLPRTAPTVADAAWLAGRLFATRTRTAGTLLVVLLATLITLAAHAAA